MSEVAATRPKGLVAKRDAILQAACTVFGRDGFDRAGIDAIAAEAAVSTRTIYNHFGGKEQLFFVVVQESCTQVANALIEVVDRELADVTDIENALLRLARALADVKKDHCAHFAMIRQLLDSPHVPEQARRAWEESGPLRTQRTLALRLAELAVRGVLVVADPEVAAQQYMTLTLGGPGASHAVSDEAIRAGVHTFLYGHLPRP